MYNVRPTHAVEVLPATSEQPSPGAPAEVARYARDQESGAAVIAETSPHFREVLTQLLSKHLNLRIATPTEDLGQALRLTWQLRPDLVVLDRHAPGADLLDVVRCIRQVMPHCCIVVTSSDCQRGGTCPPRGVAGADLCVPKTLRAEELLPLLPLLGPAARGPDGRGRARPAATAPASAGPAGAALATLSEKELVILGHLARGRSVAEIAHILGRSRKTVDSHKTHLMAKLDLHNRVVLVRFAIRCGLVSAWDE